MINNKVYNLHRIEMVVRIQEKKIFQGGDQSDDFNLYFENKKEIYEKQKIVIKK